MEQGNRFEFKNKEDLDRRMSSINQEDTESFAFDEFVLRLTVNKIYMRMTGGQERHSKDELLDFHTSQCTNYRFVEHLKAIEEEAKRLRDISVACIIYAGSGFLNHDEENPEAKSTDAAADFVTTLFNEANANLKTEWVKNKLDLVYQDINMTVVNASNNFVLSQVSSYASRIMEKERMTLDREKESAARPSEFLKDDLKLL